jgi:uncharacterized protein YktA (UPF0223 family)
MKFEDLSNEQLKGVIRQYNHHLKIVYSKLKRDDLLKLIKKHFEIDDEKIQLKRIEPIYFDLPDRKTRKNKRKNKRHEDEIRIDLDEFADDLTEAERRYLEKEKQKHDKERLLNYQRHKQNFLPSSKEEWKHYNKFEREITYEILRDIYKHNKNEFDMLPLHLQKYYAIHTANKKRIKE